MLKHLNIEEMVALIAPCVRKTRRRTTFLPIPEIVRRADHQGDDPGCSKPVVLGRVAGALQP
jgi:hypothetical protein